MLVDSNPVELGSCAGALRRAGRPHRLAIGASALALILSAGAANAQEAPEAPPSADAQADDEIVVRARKRDEVLTKIPETISVVTAAQIEKVGLEGLDDIGRLTPNVRLNRRQDNEPNVVIRGVGSFGNTQGVGFYIDDVQNFTDQTASIEDVERIEILKGPQGTLYGGSNVGGAIKYVMVKPTNELGMHAKAEYGTFDTTRLFGALNVPVAEKLAVRVSSYYNRTDGFVRNVFLDRQSDAMEEWGIRGALRWTPIDELTIDLSYRHNELRAGGNVFVIFNGDEYVRETAFNEQGFARRTVDGGILTANYEAGFADITSVTSYTRRVYSFRTDSDYSPLDVLLTSSPSNKTDVFTQELRLSSSGEGPFTWLVGAYYAQIDDLSPLSRVNLRVGADMPPPPDGIGPGPFEIPLYNLTSTFRQKALFGTIGYRTGPFKIEGGLRIGRSEFDTTFFDLGVSAEANDTKLLPKLTLSYDIDDNTMLYGNIGVGSEPGRVNITGPLPYRPERATSVELGIKGSAFDRRLRYDVAAFYIDYRDRQLETQFLDANNVLTEAITNIGTSRGYGIEAGLTYRPTRELTFSVSGGYLYSKWHDRDARYQLQPVDGLRIANAPKFSGNASVDYTRELGGTLALGLRADVSHTGSFYWDVLNTGEQKAYTLVNLRASVGQVDSGWEFAIRGDNVFNQKYYNDVVPNIFGPGVNAGAPGRPATVTASISLRY